MTPKMVKKLADRLEIEHQLKDYFVTKSVDPWIEAEMFEGWEHGAVLSILQIKEKESTPKWIANRLNITAERAQEVIDKLLEFGLLEKNGKDLAPIKDAKK